MIDFYTVDKDKLKYNFFVYTLREFFDDYNYVMSLLFYNIDVWSYNIKIF